jgi:hypothetical protein
LEQRDDYCTETRCVAQECQRIAPTVTETTVRTFRRRRELLADKRNYDQARNGEEGSGRQTGRLVTSGVGKDAAKQRAETIPDKDRCLQ